MKGQLNIETMFAFVLRDDDGTEGVVAFITPQGIQTPLVGADLDRVESLKPLVQEIATRTGKAISLIQFTTREEIETIEPNRQVPPTAVRVGEHFGFL